ncbi:MAG: histidine kinase [Ideonella sp.]|nr:histidine kinase [Ideonella sp.]
MPSDPPNPVLEPPARPAARRSAEPVAEERTHSPSNRGADAAVEPIAGRDAGASIGWAPTTAFGSDGASSVAPDRTVSGFPPTQAGPRRFEPSRRPMPPVFDVCHAGVVLRAVAVVHAGLAIAVAFVATGPVAWLGSFAIACLASLPALLVGLIAACALKRVVAPWPAATQALGAAGLGAASGVAGVAVQQLAGLDAVLRAPWGPAALAGAGVGLGLAYWLQLRARALAPADADARLAQLQSRIRPHFLFNTLNSAVALVRVDPARAEGVLEDLAELFRAVLAADATPGAAVTLDEEVALARRYLEIEQVRFADRLRVRWELDPAAGAARVPLLLLQPLVENAVRHGVEPSEAGGTVRVRTRVRRGEVWLSIANSVPREASRPGTGLALANVRERLRLMHDVAARFDAGPDGEDVWRVQIVVPLAS